MDTNIKIVEKIDPLTILGRAIKIQETNRFLPIMGVKDVDPFLETCRNQLRTLKDKIVCSDCVCQFLCDNPGNRLDVSTAAERRLVD